MSEIKELESRLAAALGRIGRALAQPPEPPREDPELVRLREALEAETVVTSQLEARVAALHQKADATGAEAAALRDELAQRDALVRQLRRVNDVLRSNNAALREAVVSGLDNGRLLDHGMLAELESIRASHAADRAEVDAVLAQLEPLLREAADA